MGTETKTKIIGITGVRGFIGTHLANRLVELGYHVVGFDNMSHVSSLPLSPKVEVRYGDVRRKADCHDLASDCHALIHLAAEISVDKSIEDPEHIIDVNIKGTINMLDAAMYEDIPILIASSSEVYGTAMTDIQDETHELRGQSPYAASKIAADRLAYAYYKTYEVDARIVRAFNVCGEGQGKDSYGAVIAIFADKVKRGDTCVVYGTGEQTRDYTHVSDTVEGYIKILEKGKAGEVYNIATGEDWTVTDVFLALNDLSPTKALFVHGPERPGEVMKLKGDASKLRALGWEPKITFKEAIQRIWNHVTS
jgi:nucleoside-diphosphate-sugar epimerase